jgi:hypothetical protein
MKRFSRSFLFCCIVLCPGLASAQDLEAPLRKILNKGNYTLVYPLNNAIYAGGLVRAQGNRNEFWGLPPSVTLSDDDIDLNYHPTWGGGTSSGGLGVSAVVTAIGKVFGGIAGGISVNHSSTLDSSQIDATGQRVKRGAVLDSLIANSDVADVVKGWLNHNYRVYFVQAAIDTTNLNVSSASNTDIAAALQGTVQECTPPAAPAAPAAVAPGVTKPAAGTPKPPPDTPAPAADPSKPAANTPAPAADASKPATGSAKPGGNICVAVGRSNQLTVTTNTPLTFAVTLNRVSLSDGKLWVGLPEPVPGGELTQPPPPRPGEKYESPMVPAQPLDSSNFKDMTNKWPKKRAVKWGGS